MLKTEIGLRIHSEIEKLSTLRVLSYSKDPMEISYRIQSLATTTTSFPKWNDYCIYSRMWSNPRQSKPNATLHSQYLRNYKMWWCLNIPVSVLIKFVLLSSQLCSIHSFVHSPSQLSVVRTITNHWINFCMTTSSLSMAMAKCYV